MRQDEMKKFIEENYEDMLELLRQLCYIPAPSHNEEARAEYCKNWLEANGAEGVYVDEALNVVYPLNCEGSNEITVLAAHTDTVFPDTEPLPYKEDEENIYCPGVGDDTASVAVLLMTAKYFIQQSILPPGGILFVCNSCEEGLGNLKGTRKLMQDYEGRIARFITFDSQLGIMNSHCVGSHRYQVEVKTEGGHSFQAFGKPNAIAVASKMISNIYELQVPQFTGSRTSYNVGIIGGGTSVNTIAQNAEFLCEYRSDNVEALAVMQGKFEEIFAAARTEGVEVCVTKIGERPCAKGLDENKQEALASTCRKIIEQVTGMTVTDKSASTDCNIPLSKGIEAVCIGVYRGAGSHTREEWMEKESLKPGLEIALHIARAF